MAEALFPVHRSWVTSTLGDVAALGGGNVQTGPFGSQLHASDYVSFGIPSVMPQNIGDNTISVEGIARIRVEDAQRLSKYRLRVGDIVYSRRGDVERRALIRPENDGWLCGTGCLRVRFGKGHVVPEYAAFYLGHPSVRAWIVQHAVGATMPNLNTKILSDLPFVLPPTRDQQSIAEILGSLDDKIELNRRTKETLEAMVQAIFRDWFVDFGPTRRKIEGATDPVEILGGLVADADRARQLANLFPALLGDNGLPVGWRIGRLDDIANIHMGASPKGDTYNEEGIGTPLANGPVEFGDYFLIKRKWTTSPTRLSQYGDYIICVRGSTTGRRVFADGVYCLGRGVAAIRGRDGQQDFVNATIDTFIDVLLQKTTGSVFPNLSGDDIRGFACLVPPSAIANEFSSFASPLRCRVWHNVEEVTVLAETRDLLLPKLMSGEITIRDAEQRLEAAQ
ncbi:restriction endonuclease subunit S [Mesorhizobium sp. M0088]|uniref:restriction endonuclease subunit S n=1 Tax=Mesorhizobium sp. M0088 TaxID=2956873 RepID=UPI0033387763